MIRMVARLWAWWTHPMREVDEDASIGEVWVGLSGLIFSASLVPLAVTYPNPFACPGIVWASAVAVSFLLAPTMMHLRRPLQVMGVHVEEEIARQKTLAKGGTCGPKESDDGLTVADERGALSEVER